MTRINFNQKAIGLIVAPLMVASIVSAMSPTIGKTADETSQPWERYKHQVHSNFSGFIAESQQSISTAISGLDSMPVSKIKRNEAKALLIQERTVLNTLSKASTSEQLLSVQELLSKTANKLGEFKFVPQSFAKAHLAAVCSLLYSSIKMDELERINTPDKSALPWVKYMDQQHKAVQQNVPDYKSSKSHRFVTAIHNFYTCGLTSTRDATGKPRDTSKESAK